MRKSTITIALLSSFCAGVAFSAEKKIILECEDLEIKTKKSGKIDIGSTFDLNVKDKANIKAGPQLNIKASRVNIN